MLGAARKGALGTSRAYFRGFLFPFRGAAFVYVRHPALLRLALGPIVLTFLALALATWLAWDRGDDLVEWLWARPDGDGFWYGVVSVLHAVTVFVSRLAAWLVGVFVVLFVLLSPLAAPFNDALSARVEQLAAATPEPPAGFAKFVRDLGRTVLFEIAKALLKLVLGGMLFVLGLVIPPLAPVSGLVGVVFATAFPALDYTDWSIARRDHGLRYRVAFLRRHLPTMLGFGTAVWAMLFIPLLNLLFMPAAVAGGTLLYLELEARDQARSASGP